MSELQLSNQYPLLPCHLSTLYDWLKVTEPTWGFTIYRTAYTPQSSVAFPAIVELITAYVKHGFYREYQDLLETSRQGIGHTVPEDGKAVFDRIWATYKPRVIEEAAQFDGASIDSVRSHFEGWVEERDMADRYPDYRMFIVVDEECLKSLMNAPMPEECPVEIKVEHFVKLVEAWQEPDPPFLGWMKCSLKGLWGIWRNMQDGDYMRNKGKGRGTGGRRSWARITNRRSIGVRRKTTRVEVRARGSSTGL